MSDWPTARMSDLIDRRVLEIGDGYRAKNSELGPSGVPFVRAGDIENGINLAGADHLLVDRLEYARGKTSKPNDVVFTSKGTVGRTAFVPEGLPEFVYSPQLCFWRVLDRSAFEPRFIYYWLVSSNGQSQLAALKDQTDMAPYVSLRDQRTIRLPSPPTHVQTAIGEVLGALDDKIDLNRRIAFTAEALLRAAYGSVDGRRSATLGEIAEFVRDAVNPADLSPDIPYIGLEHMPQGSITLEEWASASGVASGKSRFRIKDVLFGKLRPYFHKVGLAPVDGVCSQEIVVLRPAKPDLLAATLIEASSNEIIAYATVVSSGTRMPRVNWQELAAFSISVPAESGLAEFNRLAEPLIDLIIRSIHENRTIAQLRDALLPELISGRMTIN